MDRAVFDRDDLLARVDGDRPLARELVETFLASTPELVTSIHDALASGDARQIERAAHTLRGALASLSAGAAARAAGELERLARARELEACRPAARVVDAELSRLDPALRRYLGDPT